MRKFIEQLWDEPSFWIKPHKNASNASLVVDHPRVAKYIELTGDWAGRDWHLVQALESFRKVIQGGKHGA